MKKWALILSIATGVAATLNPISSFAEESYPTCQPGDVEYRLLDTSVSATEIAIRAKGKAVCSWGSLDQRSQANDSVWLGFIDGKLLCRQTSDEKRIEAMKIKKRFLFIRGSFDKIIMGNVMLSNCEFIIDET